MFSLNYLKGKMPLGRAFWIYGVLVPAVYMAIITAIFMAVAYLQNHYFGTNWVLIERLGWVAGFVGAPITLFGLLAIWQCAGNCKHRHRTWFAVGFVVVMLALLVNKWVWVVIPAKGELTRQFVFSGICWAVMLLAGLIGWWAYRGAPTEGWLKQRIIPLNLVLIVTLQLTQGIFFAPRPVQVLMGQDGMMTVGHVLDYRKKLKRMDKALAQSVAQLERKAEKGNADAAYDLGATLMSEDFSGANNTEAVRWLQFAIDHGVTFAKNEMAILYQEGRGVDKDLKKALKLYQEGSAAGDDTATYNLGLMYERGEGVPVNYEKAAKYYQHVVDRIGSNPDGGCAENDLGTLYMLGKGVKANEVEARTLFEAAARKEFAVKLSPDTKDLRLVADFNFPDAYATYRMTKIKRQSLSQAGLTGDEMIVAEAVANYYEKKCRS